MISSGINCFTNQKTWHPKGLVTSPYLDSVLDPNSYLFGIMMQTNIRDNLRETQCHIAVALGGMGIDGIDSYLLNDVDGRISRNLNACTLDTYYRHKRRMSDC